MSPDVLEGLNFHRQSMRRMLEAHADLLNNLQTEDPSLIERGALASVLHSFYMGVESIMRLVTVAYGEKLEKTERWHVQLLRNAANANDYRPALISASTVDKLYGYLAFRHRFRNLYTDVLN